MWCEDCNRVAYCSRECRAREVRNHSRECDGRWKQARGEKDTRELRNVAGHLARNGGFEPTTAPQESSSGNSQNVSKGDDLSDEHTSEGGTGEYKTEELKDSIIDLVFSARQREDVWREACPDARKHHEERRVKEAVRMEELVAAFRGGSACLSITADELENARQWLASAGGSAGSVVGGRDGDRVAEFNPGGRSSNAPAAYAGGFAGQQPC